MKHIWILNRESGVCLFEQYFGGDDSKPAVSQLDSDLFTGFVAAIFSFSQVISGSAIDMMMMTDGTLYYRMSDYVVIVILAEKTEVPAKVKQILSEIEHEFLQDYRSALETNLGDDTAIFEPFGNKVLQIVRMPVVLTPSDRTEELRDTLLRLMHKEISLEDAYSDILGMYDGVRGPENTQLAKAMSQIGSLLKHVTVEQRLTELVIKLENEMAHWGKRAKLFIFGLDNAGKTAIINRLQGNPFEPTKPTLAADIEQMEKNHLIFHTFDMAGQVTLRPNWFRYLPESDGLIFVIDYNDPQRFKEAFSEFVRVVEDPDASLRPILIYANKKDLYKKFEISKFASIFELRKLLKHPWKVVPCSAKTGEGLEAGLNWLVDCILAFVDRTPQ